MKNFFSLLALLSISLLCQAHSDEFLITKYGAKGDGKTLNTIAIQKAIDAATKVGGTVVIPKGNFVSATIFLKSNIKLELSPASKIIASSNINDYKTMTWGHHEDRTPWHLLVAKGQQNIHITGTGTIDGNGPAYWEKERKDTFSFYREIEYRPSPLVEIQECQQVIIENISIVNSPGWTLHIYNCDEVKIDKITVNNSLYGPNSDAIDITGSHDVSISNCYLSAGDDAIALKTTEDSRTCERVTISNCIFQTNCVALRIGFESRKDFKDITMTNCVVKNASRVLDIRTVEGGNIENVVISGVTGKVDSGWAMDRVIEIDANKVSNPYPVLIKEHPNYGKAKPVAKAGYIKNVVIENMIIRTSGRILLSALPETTIENVTFRNITMSYFMLEDPYTLGMIAKSPGFASNMPFVRSERAALVAENVNGLNISNFKVNWPTYPVSDDCLLLKSANRLYNPTFFQGNDAKIKSGEIRVTFTPFAFKNVKQAVLDVNELTASDGSNNLINNQNSLVIMK